VRACMCLFDCLNVCFFLLCALCFGLGLGFIVYYLFVAMLKLVLTDCLMSVFITLFNCLLFVLVTDVQTFVCVISICIQ